MFVTLLQIHDISSDCSDLYKCFSDQNLTRSALVKHMVANRTFA